MRQERIFFTVLFIAITVLAVIIMQPFLTYIVLAAILTYTLYPVYRFIQRRLGRPELSSAISLIIALLIIILPTFFLVSELVQQVSGAYNNLQFEHIQRIADYLSGLTGNQVDFQAMLASSLDQIRRSIVGLAPDILGSVTSVALGLFIMFFVMYYGFREAKHSLRESRHCFLWSRA